VAAAVAPANPTPPPAPPAPPVPAVPAVPTPTATPVVTAAAPPVVITAPRAAPVPVGPAVTASSSPVPIVPPLSAPAQAPAANLGLQNLDRAEALLPPPPVNPSKSVDTPEFLPSTPRPAGDQSTLALVWKPTIERLGAAPPEQRNYDVIDYARLKDEQGRRVRLITDGGKKLEGFVVSVDDSGVSLRVSGGTVGGDLQYVIPKARIQQFQLFHRTSPPA
jgi:hypothetical protein